MKQLVLVVGAGGQLGEAMSHLLEPRHEVVPRTRDELDIADREAVQHTVNAIVPDVVVNCAAYTSVDAAQVDPVTALTVNAWGVRTLAEAAGDIDATFVHFSTDFVFDGETDRPYTEEDEPNPRGTYAVSKLLGEWLAADCPKHYVLRVESLFGGQKGHSSVDRLLDGLLADAAVRAFCDRTVSPSYVEDVVAATAALLERKAPPGLYHCVNSGFATWSQLTYELARIVGRENPKIDEVRMADAGLPTPRPRFAALSNGKLERLGIVMPTWQEALRRYVEARAGEVSWS